MTLDLTKEQTAIDAGKRLLTLAQDDFEKSARALLASDGKTPIFAQPEHDARMAALRETMAARLASVDEKADGVLASIEAARLSEHADPLASLDLAQLSLAGQYRPFVREDCVALPVPQLTARLEWAAASKDAGLRFCYARYGAQRFQALVNADPQPAGVPELRAALEKLGAIGAARGLSPEAENLRYAAAGLKRAASYALSNGRPAGTGAPMGL